MKVTSRKAIVFIIIACSFFNSLHAQFIVPKHEIGVGVGMFVYQGDLTAEDAGAFKSPGFAFNIFYNRLLSRSFSLRTNLAHGKLMADDANYKSPEWRKERAFRFGTRVTEISELLVWNILGNNYGDRKIISPYIFGGIGISALRITRDWSNINYDYFASETSLLEGLAEDSLHTMPNTIAVLPVGLGLRYPVTNKLSVMAEASYRFTFSDYIDGFSKASNPDRNDYYSNISIGLIYTFGKRSALDCPIIRN
jgi:hypothetical protein